MNWLDWVIVICPVIFIMFMGFYIRRYIRGVSDFLVCGRVCRRYVITTANMANALGLITLVAFIEVHYKTGFALTFWNSITLPITVIMSLTGYCIYRFRETKAMSIGQFIEMRYNRSLRIFACFVRSIAELMANIIMPAIAARFFIAFLGFPQKVVVFGFEIPTFMIIVAILLTLAIAIIYMGGMLAINVTDTIQGLICFPVITVFIIFFLIKFSWSGEVVQVMSDRVAGESFLNPYDIQNLRDFNIFMLITSILNTFLNHSSGLTGGSNSALSAHEAKMGAILGSWRGAFTTVFYIAFAIAILTMMNHVNFAEDAKAIRTNISKNIAEELIIDNAERQKFINAIEDIPVSTHIVGKDAPLSHKQNLDTVYYETAQKQFGTDGEGSSKAQQYKTLFNQLMLPGAMRHMLPTGLAGLFCLMIILFIISTDDSRIYSACSTLVQDCVVPFYKNETLSPEKHILWIRMIAVGIGILFFFGSFFMSQLDYINMFVQIMYGMWTGGAGPMLIFGFYSSFGTTAGAWASLLSGMGVSFLGIFLQRNWAETIYPYLEANGMVEAVGNFLATASKPFNPYIVWEMNRLKCPINAYEFFFMAMVASLLVYIVVSYLTCKERFNLDRMLHRGIYSDGEQKLRSKWSIKTVFGKLIGITPEYSKGDKLISYLVFGYTFGYKFFIGFILVVFWNLISPWKMEWWGHYFLFFSLVIPGIAAAVTTVWYGIGGTVDLFRLFRDLENRIVDPLDNGMVEGHVSLSDKKRFAEVEKENQEK